MSESIISVNNLSKKYRIGLEDEKHESLTSALISAFKAPFKNYRNLKNLTSFSNEEERDIFWALRDINFEVKRGETIAIIGKNGAGKSTLLKVLSRITEPSSGRIQINGRVASLLEVGTGFHPELTGRENIYLNGTVLGMRKKEIDVKLDEIISFSGVEKFIDTPIKRYSSGMKVRLAFSVAANLDPEILIIDEVLAVGDAEFQKKCLGKMEDVAGQGRTILFVSHNMAAVKSLCSKGLFLEQGKKVFEGDIVKSIELYNSALANKNDNINSIFNNVNINNGNDIINSEPFFISFQVNIPEDITGPSIFCIIMDGENNIVIHKQLHFREKNEYRNSMNILLEFPALHLKDFIYSVHFKMIGSSVLSKGRFLSDNYTMNVVSRSEVVETYGILVPECKVIIT